MSAVITFRDVSKSYGGAEAVRDLSLSIEKGEFITVLGASGGGKTTFLKMINGLVEPTSGEITVLGEISCSCAARSAMRFREACFSRI